MKSGYDQFFAKAKKAARTPEGRPEMKSMPRNARVKKTLSPAAHHQANATGASAQSTEELVKHLRLKMQKEKVKIKTKRKTPVFAMLSCVIGLAVAGWGYMNLQKVESIVKKVEFHAFGIAQAEEAKPAVNEKSKTDEKSADGKADAATTAAKTEKKEYTEEELNHFARMNDRKKELDAREEELQRMEQELAAQKEVLDKRLQELDSTRKNISSMLQDRVQADDKKVESLVQVYTNMKPQQAAKVFETMDEDLAVEIIGRMKKKNAAEVMNLIKAEKAQMISEKLAGYRRAVASTPSSSDSGKESKESKK